MTLPQGYDTPGSWAVPFRAASASVWACTGFLHDAPYILLDEPTSNLDSLNEAVI